MAIEHKIILSTTEPNNHVCLRFRQDDTLTQVISAEVTANGKILSFAGCDVEFVNITRSDSGQPIIEKVTDTVPASGRITFKLNNRCLQWLGENTAYFSFKNKNGVEVFSTQNFTYTVERGAHSGCILDSGYLWNVDELIKRMTEYQQVQTANWEEFIKLNRDIILAIDPGGELLLKLHDLKGEMVAYTDKAKTDAISFAEGVKKEANDYTDTKAAALENKLKAISNVNIDIQKNGNTGSCVLYKQGNIVTLNFVNLCGRGSGGVDSKIGQLPAGSYPPSVIETIVGSNDRSQTNTAQIEVTSSGQIFWKRCDNFGSAFTFALTYITL